MEKGDLHNFLKEGNIILISKPYKSIIRKCRPIFLMNINAKILNNIIAY